METVLRALRQVDFEWTTHIDHVWNDLPFDVPGVQSHARSEVSAETEQLLSGREASPLGIAVVGAAGAGKTHLLSSVRREAIERGLFFILVDMTDVSEFWDTAILGFLRSLQHQGHGGRKQHHRLLQGLVDLALGQGEINVKRLEQSRPPGLINQCDALIKALAKRHPAELREHRDVLKALVLFNSDDLELQDLGYKFLQGIPIDDEEKFHFAFRENRRQPLAIVRGLSWLSSLVAPTLLALDQLDAIVAEHNLLSSAETGQELNARQQTSLGIIQGLAGGLMALRDVTRRTLTVVSSLEATWNILDARVAVSMRDRFRPPLLLRPVSDASLLTRLVEQRLSAPYSKVSFSPPYPTYPFQASFFACRAGATPREVLKACDEHRRTCLLGGTVMEANGEVDQPLPSSRDHTRFRERFEAASRAANPGALLDTEDDEALDRLVETACAALAAENPVPDDVDVAVDRDFAGTKSFDPLHARIRLIYRSQGDRELHYAFRFLQKNNSVAFQARLKAAMTASGIDHKLPFRKLAILRRGPIPGGAATERLVAEFQQRGGVLLDPDFNELKQLHALAELLNGPDGVLVENWLKQDPVVSKMTTFQDALAWLFPRASAFRSPPRAEESKTIAQTSSPVVAAPSAKRSTAATSRPAPTPATQPTVEPTRLRVGRRLLAGTPKDPLDLPLENFTKHVVVLAGAGSGKTVLLRRLIEEAVLLGVPSIVVDGANDLARLGDAWPEVPSDFSDEDSAKAKRYHATAEVVLWTPGRESGNPLNLALIPDFSSVRDQPDELQAAIDMVRSSLEPIVAPGKGEKDKVTRGVLASALRYFANSGGKTLQELIALLVDLPADAHPGFERAEKQARAAGELLMAAIETNPLLRGRGTELDPSQLLTASTPNRVRVSVINLSGLPDAPAQQHFVNQLTMTLFSWIKKNPPKGRSLQGLLVIDEARDFVPSGHSVPSKDNLVRLVAQARKYGLGILFATQAPKSIDHNVIANASTHFYGRANSPAAIEVVQEQLKERGGSGSDVAKLPRGTFYVFSEGLAAPAKIATSLCLSYHPSSPPDEKDILSRAASSRRVVRQSAR